MNKRINPNRIQSLSPSIVPEQQNNTFIQPRRRVSINASRMIKPLGLFDENQLTKEPTNISQETPPNKYVLQSNIKKFKQFRPKYHSINSILSKQFFKDTNEHKKKASISWIQIRPLSANYKTHYVEKPKVSTIKPKQKSLATKVIQHNYKKSRKPSLPPKPKENQLDALQVSNFQPTVHIRSVSAPKNLSERHFFKHRQNQTDFSDSEDSLENTPVPFYIAEYDSQEEDSPVRPHRPIYN